MPLLDQVGSLSAPRALDSKFGTVKCEESEHAPLTPAAEDVEFYSLFVCCHAVAEYAGSSQPRLSRFSSPFWRCVLYHRIAEYRLHGC